MIAGMGTDTGTAGNEPGHFAELVMVALEADEELRARRREANMAHERPTWRDWPTHVGAAAPTPARQFRPRARCRQHQVSRR